MNLNVYASEKAKLTLGNVDDRNFTDKGTADPYLPGDPAADVMYAYKISRDCGKGDPERNCLELSPPQDCNRLTLGPDTLLPSSSAYTSSQRPGSDPPCRRCSMTAYSSFRRRRLDGGGD